MPTYDYLCEACDHKFEHFQSITDPLLKKCPECKKNRLRRLFGTGAAIVFKGSGFYQTDYRSDSYRKGAEADKPPSEKSSNEKSSSEKGGDGGGDKGGKQEGGAKAADGKSSAETSKPKKKKGAD